MASAAILKRERIRRMIQASNHHFRRLPKGLKFHGVLGKYEPLHVKNFFERLIDKLSKKYDHWLHPVTERSYEY